MENQQLRLTNQPYKINNHWHIPKRDHEIYFSNKHDEMFGLQTAQKVYF